MVCTHVLYESNLEISTAISRFSNIKKFDFLIVCNEFIKLSFFQQLSFLEITKVHLDLAVLSQQLQLFYEEGVWGSGQEEGLYGKTTPIK